MRCDHARLSMAGVAARSYAQLSASDGNQMMHPDQPERDYTQKQ